MAYTVKHEVGQTVVARRAASDWARATVRGFASIGSYPHLQPRSFGHVNAYIVQFDGEDGERFVGRGEVEGAL